MKKLLSLISAVTLTVTPVSTVVACGSTSEKEDDGQTSSALKGGSLGDITGDSIFKDWIKQGNMSALFGSTDKAIPTFMNYFSQAVMNKSADIEKDAKDLVSKGKIPQYYDDGTFDAIKTDNNNQKTAAENAWNDVVKDAPGKYGKKWEDELFKSFQTTYGKKISVNGTITTATNYKQYKDVYISQRILSGNGNSTKSLANSLTDDIYRWIKTGNKENASLIISNAAQTIFNQTDLNLVPGKDSINFENNKTNQGIPTEEARKDTWFGQFDNLLSQLNLATESTTKTNVSKTIVDMINITGGLSKSDTTTYGLDISDSINGMASNTLKIDNYEALTVDTLMSNLKSNGQEYITKLSNELVKRWDASYDTDFGEHSIQTTTNVKDLTINEKYNFSNSINSVFDNQNNSKLTDEVNGFYSNTQRYIANDYYNIQKPVAVSEIVVSPLYTENVSYDKQITNSGYVGNNPDLMKQLSNFITNFVNNDASINGTSQAKTNDTLEGTSNYTWDMLMKAGISKLPDFTYSNGAGTDDNADFTSDFAGKLSFKDHSSLLTINSSSSDYSDLAKYSIYDFLNKTSENKVSDITYNFKDNNKTYVSQAVSGDASMPDTYGKDDLAKNSFNSLSNLIQSMNRTGKTNKQMYQVVNAKQGIISYVDKDGIHFIRVEGYGLFNSSIVKEQSPLSLTGSYQEDYQAAETLHDQLQKSETKDNALNITTDYLDSAQKDNGVDYKNTGVSYSQLNQSFGNKYLQFLANASMGKTAGAANAKYSFDLNSTLKSYYGSDFTEDTYKNSTSMLMFLWDYFKTILDKTDVDLFNYMFPNKTGDSLFKDSYKDADLSEDTKIDFANLYEKYILNTIQNFDSSRLTKNRTTLQRDWSEADDSINNTANDPTILAHKDAPTLKWSDASTNKDDYYSSQIDEIYNSNYWQSFEKKSPEKMYTFSDSSIKNLSTDETVTNSTTQSKKKGGTK